ncbi:hypothetical protein GCM10010503_37980 [Streptomyces lucensis JCM 4490]|uniref:Uncharacterized protein n=1 Tax=Streptomyces lucensis JCM 4490 TaxID=1306176 RepID=A0A918J7S4_9ACTN|nr:hypothetical protein GCM10010503_37980 [Streptomyces lucensis JCM 4490]
MPLTVPPRSVTVVLDPGDDTIHTHTALTAHHPPSDRITLHPGPGTTSEAGLAHDLLAALGKPLLLPGRFPGGRQPVWEAAATWMTALPVTWLTVLRAHRLTARRAVRLLQLQALTGLHLTLVCHRPHLPAALHQALRTAYYCLTADFEAARRHYYGAPITEYPPPAEPVGPASRWLTLPALDRLASYDSPRPCRPVHAAPDRLAAPATARYSRSSPWCTTSPGLIGSVPPVPRCCRVRCKQRCQSTGQAGHQAGSMSSSCSLRSCDSTPTADAAGSPSACRCSSTTARRAAARVPARARPAGPRAGRPR